MEMTVGKAGAEGVMLAISDAMQAAEYARRLKAATAENDRLRNDLAGERAMNRRLAKENRYHRFTKSRAYAEVLNAQAEDVSSLSLNRWKNAVVFLLGMVAGLAVAFGIVWCSGV